MSIKALTAAGLIVFLALSLTDLVFTWVLIRHGGGRVQEGNPIASAWLMQFGWNGLAIFKLILMAVVVVIVALLSRNHPRTGLAVVLFGCLAVGLVVLYSYQLLSDAGLQESSATICRRALSIEF
jgi:hypothetical protein